MSEETGDAVRNTITIPRARGVIEDKSFGAPIAIGAANLNTVDHTRVAAVFSELLGNPPANEVKEGAAAEQHKPAQKLGK